MGRTLVMLALCTAVAWVGCASRQSVKTTSSQKQSKITRIRFAGGNGDSQDSAVVIVGARDPKEGMKAEADFISMQHGEKGKDWRLSEQSVSRENGKVYDIIGIMLAKADEMHYMYFDITDCAWSPKSKGAAPAQGSQPDTDDQPPAGSGSAPASDESGAPAPAPSVQDE